MGVCTSRQKFATLAAGTDYLSSRVLCIEIDAAHENLVSLHSEGCHLAKGAFAGDARMKPGGSPPPGRGRGKVAVITPATFVLMIIVGASPAQQRGEFGSYHDCYEAAQREVASLGADVRWDCLPKSRDREQE